MYTLFTDTDCDITPAIAAKYGYHLISMPYMIDGKEIRPYIDFEEFDYKTFYDRLRGGALPTTSALSPVDYMNYFEPEFAKGNDILYVHFSAAMSATFNSMRIALEELHEKYPDRKVETIDTKGITLGSYVIVQEIGKLFNEGKSVEEIKAWAAENVDKTGFYFYADDLNFFHKSGRVSGFSAVFGNMLQFKPIIFIDSDGQMHTKTKARGRKKTLETLLGFVKELGDDVKNHPVVIAHTDALPIVEEFAAMLKKEYGDDLNIEVEVVNPTAGAHCGPNCIGVTFHAIHR